MDKHLYLVIIADIRESRKIKDRLSVQVKLERVLAEINRVYNHAIASQFIITLGDEFQGVLHEGLETMSIVSKIQRDMHPIALRFGIGVGSLSLPLKVETSLGSDGPAFHLAREMIAKVKTLEGKKAKSKTNILISIEGQEHAALLLNSILKLTSGLQNSWSERQREIIAAYEEYNETQTEIAKRLGIVQSSVQKSLASSQFYAYKEASNTVAHTIQTILGARH